ncbi:hypothetical protein MRB53_042421 [Persea americana]|nr:hypothetical protein MRB53_042421 [Persea americana]
MTPFAKRRGPSIHPDREKWTQPVLRTSGYNPKDSLSLDSRHVLMSVYGTSTPGQTELGSSEEEARNNRKIERKLRELAEASQGGEFPESETPRDDDSVSSGLSRGLSSLNTHSLRGSIYANSRHSSHPEQVPTFSRVRGEAQSSRRHGSVPVESRPPRGIPDLVGEENPVNPPGPERVPDDQNSGTAGSAARTSSRSSTRSTPVPPANTGAPRHTEYTTAGRQRTYYREPRTGTNDFPRPPPSVVDEEPMGHRAFGRRENLPLDEATLERMIRRVLSRDRRGERKKTFLDYCHAPDAVLPVGYRMPKFSKYDGTTDPELHFRNLCNEAVEFLNLLF